MFVTLIAHNTGRL